MTPESRGFAIACAVNQFLCSILFAPVALPRETICGLIGRYSLLTQDTRARRLARWVAPHFESWCHKDETCIEVHQMEDECRKVLYPQYYG